MWIREKEGEGKREEGEGEGEGRGGERKEKAGEGRKERSGREEKGEEKNPQLHHRIHKIAQMQQHQPAICSKVFTQQIHNNGYP